MSTGKGQVYSTQAESVREELYDEAKSHIKTASLLLRLAAVQIVRAIGLACYGMSLTPVPGISVVTAKTSPFADIDGKGMN